MAKSRKKISKKGVASSLERLYKIVENHLISLPHTEAKKRLQAIDAAHSRLREQDSKTRASQEDMQDHHVACRSHS